MPIYKTILILPNEASVPPFQDAVEDYSLGTAAFEWEGGPNWSLEFYTDGLPQMVDLEPRLEQAAQQAGISNPDPIVAPLPDIDWVAENQKSFQPIRAGRFFVHQEFHEDPIPAGAVPLVVNAGTAFGTGTHATTWGCLVMIDYLLRMGLRPNRALDLGCGTAILAMALCKTVRQAQVVGSDIDPEAVRVAKENAQINGVLPPRLRLTTAAGLQHPVIRRGGPYNLIVANILARPLMMLSRDIIRAMAPGGLIILSGLLTEQESMVLGAYRMQGLSLCAKQRRDGWSTLLLAR
ncbi:MAG: 50S ribosomal protein L11 methyltransferase [Alphaproteobacteria bacterium]|nr:50S ribosomal protein L11 methyltransferase [Alphaproteobacteria bacterium]